MNNREPIYYATAVPVPDDPNNSSSPRMRPGLAQERSLYSLSSRKISSKIKENIVKELKDQGFTDGLASALSTNNEAFPLRIWVVDNSGSMQTADGHRIIPSKDKSNIKFSSCTRWTELKQCINYHAQMSAMLEAPTIFRLLNHPGVAVGTQQFSIAQNSNAKVDILQDVQNAESIMNRSRPGGVTPLISHIIEIQQSVTEMAPKLLKEGKRVAVVLATDGLPTDDYGSYGDLIRDQFVQALRLLEGLPVWVVVRLCTDEEKVVDFYNSLDEQLELSLEVLDDFIGEAQEVYAANPWLNYALPLHRCREMGFHDRVFDMLDERELTKDELRDFCILLFGEMNLDGMPDPEEDWNGFMASIRIAMERESLQWHPIKKTMRPWIDLNMLNRRYNISIDPCCTMM